MYASLKLCCFRPSMVVGTTLTYVVVSSSWPAHSHDRLRLLRHLNRNTLHYSAFRGRCHCLLRRLDWGCSPASVANGSRWHAYALLARSRGCRLFWYVWKRFRHAGVSRPAPLRQLWPSACCERSPPTCGLPPQLSHHGHRSCKVCDFAQRPSRMYRNTSCHPSCRTTW